MTMRYAHLSPTVRKEAVDALLAPARQSNGKVNWGEEKLQ